MADFLTTGVLVMRVVQQQKVMQHGNLPLKHGTGEWKRQHIRKVNGMGDNYIAKEEVLPFVEEMEKRTHGDDLITKTVLVTTKCVKDFVMHMPTIEPEPHWIPCAKRPPDKEGMYIVTDDAGGMATVSTDEFSHYEGGEPMWMFSQNVTAWMPLPEPYKEGKRDDYERKDIPLDTDDIFDAELAKRILNNK